MGGENRIQLKNLYLEAKWQLYRPLIWIQYGWGYLVVDLFLDLRDRNEEREELQNGWKQVKKGVIQDDPDRTAQGQAILKSEIFKHMNEATK